MKSIVIIGGGFSGTITAINLTRLSAAPLHITIIDKNPLPCRGVAYSTRNGDHLLNVVARNMSALADKPNHFVEWLSTRQEHLDEPLPTLREKFVPRRVYGEYIHNLFQCYSGPFAEERHSKIQVIRDEAKDIVVEEQQAKVTLSDGRTIIADKVILAVGNQAPSDFKLRGLDVRSSRYIGNPWMGWEERLPSNDKDILLIGTGLTMVDTFLTLQGLGWRGKIFAVSRNGLLPLSHFKGFEYPDLLDDESPAIPFRRIFSIFKHHYRAAKAKNLNTAILVDKLRPFTQRIWQNFSLQEKKQFNRHFRTRWNVMRHRIAPEIHRQLAEAIANDQLEIIKGRLRECEESGDKMQIEIQSNTVKRAINVAALINCTGPQESYVPSQSSLFINLFARGMVQPDEMNMGIKVAPNFSVVNREGHSSEILFALGALLKGTLWESTAVPELRGQAFRLAETIAERSSMVEVEEEVLEYFI